MYRYRDTDGLTPSEAAIVQHLANGSDLTQIAKREGYSSSGAVHQKLYRLKQRIDVKNTCEAVAYAFRKGLIK